MKISIRTISVSEAFDSPDFGALCDEYRAESMRNKDLAGGEPSRLGYEQMASAGLMKILGAFFGDRLVGFCTVLVTPLLHFGDHLVASTETIFLSKKYRASGAGIGLLRAAESIALDSGASGLYVTAPSGGRLERLLPRVGYTQTCQVFYMGKK